MSPTSDPEEPKKQNAVMEWLLGELFTNTLEYHTQLVLEAHCGKNPPKIANLLWLGLFSIKSGNNETFLPIKLLVFYKNFA